jgi:4a-hydroxytetrahydrobiopterin dehydratase
MPALNTKQVNLHLKAIPNWSKRAQTIVRTFKFEGFLDSIDFVKRIAKRAEKRNHHSGIDIRFNKVTLTLTTHDEGGIQKKISHLPGNAMRSSLIFSSPDQRGFPIQNHDILIIDVPPANSEAYEFRCCGLVWL